jgi:hypothetical protein
LSTDFLSAFFRNSSAIERAQGPVRIGYQSIIKVASNKLLAKLARQVKTTTGDDYSARA